MEFFHILSVLVIMKLKPFVKFIELYTKKSDFYCKLYFDRKWNKNISKGKKKKRMCRA